jgi:hypothetical protein
MTIFSTKTPYTTHYSHVTTRKSSQNLPKEAKQLFVQKKPIKSQMRTSANTVICSLMSG